MSNTQDSGWLDPRAAEGQLALVLESLKCPLRDTPPYMAFMEIMDQIATPRTLLDVGCGVGGYQALIARHFPTIAYRGCDISPCMIDVARKVFGYDNESQFFVCDVMDLREGAEVVFASCLIETIPHWREALRHLFSLDFRYLILGRVRIWTDPAVTRTTERFYETIYGTTSFEAVHSQNDLLNAIWDAGGRLIYTAIYQTDPGSQLVSLLCEKRGDAT